MNTGALDNRSGAGVAHGKAFTGAPGSICLTRDGRDISVSSAMVEWRGWLLVVRRSA